MSKTITLNNIVLKEALITNNDKLRVSLLFQRLDNGVVFDTKRIELDEADFNSSQVTKFLDILTTIATKAKTKEGI